MNVCVRVYRIYLKYNVLQMVGATHVYTHNREKKTSQIREKKKAAMKWLESYKKKEDDQSGELPARWEGLSKYYIEMKH